MVQEIRYWDVFPKSIRGFRTPNGGQNMSLQLVLCGDSRGVVFESADESVVEVTSAGVVTIGMKVGYADIRVYEPNHSEEIRKVHVQVLPCPGTAIQSIGAANAPGEDTGRYALEGHVHQGLTQFGTDVQSVGAGNAPGTRNEAARVDHVHKGAQPGADIRTVGASNVAGISDKFAREDHVHRTIWLEYTGP